MTAFPRRSRGSYGSSPAVPARLTADALLDFTASPANRSLPFTHRRDRTRAVGGRGTGRRARPGLALPATLVTLLLLTVLSVGAARLVAGDFRRSRDSRAVLAASGAADAGAYRVMRDWRTTPHESLSVGQMLGPDTLRLPNAVAITRTVRTSPSVFWTVVAAQSGDSASRTITRRGVSLAYRLAIPDMVVAAALTARDSVTLAGSAIVSGSDTTLAVWGGGCPLLGATAGVALADTTRLCDGTCGRGSVNARARGVPPLLSDSGARDTLRYQRFGAESWASLTTHAGIVLPPGAVVTPSWSLTSGQCDRARVDNWGDPLGTSGCAAYEPLIWARGDIELRGGAGQGVLIADGDVTLSNGVFFAGVIITRDDLLSSGIGGTVLGAVLAADVRTGAGDQTRLDGRTLVQRSSCAATRALERSARLRPVASRGWAPLR